jgi:hypothetical protein
MINNISETQHCYGKCEFELMRSKNQLNVAQKIANAKVEVRGLAAYVNSNSAHGEF